MQTDRYSVVGTLYNSDILLRAGSAGKLTAEDNDVDRGLGGEGQIQCGTQPPTYGNGVICGQNMSMPINLMRQYVLRWMPDGPCESENAHSQQSQRPTQMPPDGSLPSPHQPASAAGHSPQTYSECSIIYGPGHRVVPSNASGVLCGSSTPTGPRQNPSAAAAGCSRPASPVSSPVSNRSGKKIQPKIPALPRSSLPGRSPARRHELQVDQVRQPHHPQRC